jgi:hypothetical protein
MFRTFITFAVLFKRRVISLVLRLAFLCILIFFVPWYIVPIGLISGFNAVAVARSARARPKRVRPWKFARRVKAFRSLRVGRITLCFAQELAEHWDLQVILACCRQECEQLAGVFSEVHLRRIIVYLFANSKEVSEVFNRPAGGFAFPTDNIVVIAHDGFVRESVRHEMVHLFSARWNLHAPSIFREGLAVHLQGSEYGRPLDVNTSCHVGTEGRGIVSLVDEVAFFRDEQIHANYAIAGSFTRFLIRQHGWETYCHAYRTCTAKDFEATFQRAFRVTLQDAELQWRRELLVTNALFCGIRKRLQTRQSN